MPTSKDWSTSKGIVCTNAVPVTVGVSAVATWTLTQAAQCFPVATQCKKASKSKQANRQAHMNRMRWWIHNISNTARHKPLLYMQQLRLVLVKGGICKCC
jgi:hypothetical protein